MDMKKILGILLVLVGLIGFVLGAMDYSTAAGGGTTIMKSTIGFGGKTASLGVLVVGLFLMMIGLFFLKVFLKDMIICKLMGTKVQETTPEAMETVVETTTEEPKTEETTEENKEEATVETTIEEPKTEETTEEKKEWRKKGPRGKR
ncbi:MAG: hypothetical protein WC974_07410 [Thermoplasmata archaeon]